MGANSVGHCPERGAEADKSTDWAIGYYRKSTSHSCPAGVYDFERSLEHHKWIEQDLIRSVKYYRLSVKLNELSAENSFEIFLKHGIDIYSNLTLTACYYKWSTKHGRPNGANNLGFGLGHGHGVKQDFAAVAECYTFAPDRRQPEADSTYRHCFRILSHWDASDRSSHIADSQPLDYLFAHLFIDSPNDPDSNPELIAFIQRLKATMLSSPRLTVKEIGAKMACGSFSDIRVKVESDRNLTVIKTVSDPNRIKWIKKETTIHKTMNHQLIVRYLPTPLDHIPAVTTDFIKIDHSEIIYRVTKLASCTSEN
jgi:hypothetical protein